MSVLSLYVVCKAQLDHADFPTEGKRCPTRYMDSGTEMQLDPTWQQDNMNNSRLDLFWFPSLHKVVHEMETTTDEERRNSTLNSKKSRCSQKKSLILIFHVAYCIGQYGSAITESQNHLKPQLLLTSVQSGVALLFRDTFLHSFCHLLSDDKGRTGFLSEALIKCEFACFHCVAEGSSWQLFQAQ